MCIFTNIEKIENLLKILKILYEQQKDNKNADLKYILESSRKIHRYSRTLMVLTPFFICIPFLSTMSHYMQDSTWDPLFPLKLWYPFNPNDYFFSVSFCLYFFGLISALNMIATDYLFLMILAHITNQLKQLSSDLTNLKEHGQKLAELVERQIIILG